jgi:AcrR family transcriptional regulator
MSPRPRLTRERRREILEAAVHVIADRGICDTRISDVADRVGTSSALIIYYFGSKDELLTEALAFAEDRFYLESFHELAMLDRPTDRLARLIEMSTTLAGDEVTSGDWALWIELWSRALRHPDASKKREALDRRWRSTIAGIVREGQQTGEFAGVDPDAFAILLASLIDGLAIQVVLGDKDVTEELMREMCFDVASRELGFRPDLVDGERTSAR